MNDSSLTQRHQGSCSRVFQWLPIPNPTSTMVMSYARTSVWLGAVACVGLSPGEDGRGKGISTGLFLFPSLSLLDPEGLLPISGPQPMKAAPTRVTWCRGSVLVPEPRTMRLVLPCEAEHGVQFEGIPESYHHHPCSL